MTSLREKSGSNVMLLSVPAIRLRSEGREGGREGGKEVQTGGGGGIIIIITCNNWQGFKFGELAIDNYASCQIKNSPISGISCQRIHAYKFH